MAKAPVQRQPRGETRERILDVALELFTEQGYDKTSLREIAEALGFTKAALYYHFEKKEDILLALHLRLHALGSSVFEKLTDLGGFEDPKHWNQLLDIFIEQVLENRGLFLFHARNQSAMQLLEHDEKNHAEHKDMEEQMRLLLSNPNVPLELRVRMACALGAIMGSLMGAGEAFSDVPSEQLQKLVASCIRDLFGTSLQQVSEASTN